MQETMSTTNISLSRFDKLEKNTHSIECFEGKDDERIPDFSRVQATEIQNDRLSFSFYF